LKHVSGDEILASSQKGAVKAVERKAGEPSLTTTERQVAPTHSGAYFTVDIFAD